MGQPARIQARGHRMRALDRGIALVILFDAVIHILARPWGRRAWRSERRCRRPRLQWSQTGMQLRRRSGDQLDVYQTKDFRWSSRRTN
jgi:hypothetical protein